jgi:hypothetical protein
MKWLLLVACSFAQACAAAWISDIRLVPTTVPGGPPGFVTFDLLVDSSQGVTGAEVLLTLSRGSIYQNAVGGVTPPPTLAIVGSDVDDVPASPRLAADTFVAFGGFTAEASLPVALVGRSLAFPGSIQSTDSSPPLAFSSSKLDIAYIPQSRSRSPLVVDDYPIARITLANDAIGRLDVRVISNGGPPGDVRTTFAIAIPEPGTALLLVAGVVPALVARRR